VLNAGWEARQRGAHATERNHGRDVAGQAAHREESGSTAG